MADVYLTCIHKSELMKGKEVKDQEGVLVEVELAFQRCTRCGTNWRAGDPEPEVMIARMKTV